MLLPLPIFLTLTQTSPLDVLSLGPGSQFKMQHLHHPTELRYCTKYAKMIDKVIPSNQWLQPLVVFFNLNSAAFDPSMKRRYTVHCCRQRRRSRGRILQLKETHYEPKPEASTAMTDNIWQDDVRWIEWS